MKQLDCSNAIEKMVEETLQVSLNTFHHMSQLPLKERVTIKGKTNHKENHHYREESPPKNCNDKGTESAGDFENLCGAEGVQNHSKLSETKVASAERTIQYLQKILRLHRRLRIQVNSQNDSITYKPEVQKNLLDRLVAKDCREFRLFVHSVQQITTIS